MRSGQRISPDSPRRAKRRRRKNPLLFLFIGLVLGIFLGRSLWGAALSSQGTARPTPQSPSSLSGLGGDSLSPPVALRDPPACPEWIEQDFLPLNEYSHPGTKLDTVNGIVVHYVGNPGTSARQNHSYFQNLAETGETYASSHFLVGLEGEILQNVPLDEVAYCSSQRNNDTISIECCHPDEDGAFNQTTYDSLVQLVRWLMEYYDLDSSQVIRHYDVTGKECPLYYVRHPGDWEAFLAELNG